MKKVFYTSLIVVLVGAVAAFFVYTRVYNKPHKEIRSVTADYTLSADELIEAFKADEETANEKYLDKIIRIKGTIQNIDTANGNGVVTLRNGDGIESVICNMDPMENQKILGLKTGQMLEAQGLCTGFLLDVMLVRAVIVN